MVMERPSHDAQGRGAPIPGQDARGHGGLLPLPLREAFQLLHFHLLFNERHGITVSSAISSIREEELGVGARRALREAQRAGLVERYRDVIGPEFIRRGPRSAEVLRRVYGRDEPPTGESIMARARAWDEHLEARRARLEAIREAARPTEANTAPSLPAWVP